VGRCCRDSMASIENWAMLRYSMRHAELYAHDLSVCTDVWPEARALREDGLYCEVSLVPYAFLDQVPSCVVYSITIVRSIAHTGRVLSHHDTCTPMTGWLRVPTAINRRHSTFDIRATLDTWAQLLKVSSPFPPAPSPSFSFGMTRSDLISRARSFPSGASRDHQSQSILFSSSQ
jgi:hypothetical protein